MSGQLGRRGPLAVLAWTVALLLGLLSLPSLVTSAQAQTGAITGMITDESGVGVPYANIFLKGTQLGGTANAEGKFTIIKVPVGTYTLTAKAVGHAPVEKTVQVNANQTATANFQISEQAVKMKTVDITGNIKIAIRKKDSSTKQIVTSEDLRSLPVDNYKDAIGLKAGVISQGGELHFRGGRGDEVLTIVNGIASRNPLRAEGVDLGLLAVSSSEQVLGGLDAQYGNALSGVINLTTREGGDKFGGEVRYFTDRYGEADKSFNNFERLSTGFGGPFLFPKTNYFISFEGTYTDTYLRNLATHREHRFLDFIRLGNRQSNEAKLSGKLTFKLTPNEKLNFEVIKNRSLNGEFNPRWNRNGFVQVRQDSTAPTDGNVTTRYGAWSYFQVDSTYVPINTAEHLPVTNDDYLQTALTWKHTLGVGTIYNVRVSRQEWRTTRDVLDRMPWEYQQQPNQYYDPQNRLDGQYYVTNGDYPFFERKRTTTYTLNGDFSKKIGMHSFMTGGDINYNDFGFLKTNYPNVITGQGLYGADRDEFRAFNPEGSYFVQDRWEYEGMVLNAGVRYDNFSVGQQISSSSVLDPTKTQISPRIGVAYPISDRDVMSFYYGRLFQVPDRQYIYQGRLFSATARGNPNLEPQTTISYQLGVQHLFTKDIYGQFGVYFKDIFGLLTTVDQEIPGLAITVPTYVNSDYASSRGVEFTLIKRFSHGFAGEVNYTYANSTGTASDPNRALAASGNLRDQFKPTSEQPLDWDQRHNISATLNLGNEKDWRAAFVYQFGSGFPYTPHEREERRQNPELTNSKRLPSISTLSMQGERFFRAWGQNLTLYVQATNLLDAENISILDPSLFPDGAINPQSYLIYYSETGRAGGAFLTQDQDGDGREDWFPVHDPRVFSQGRTIRMGLGVQF
ncbi:MAG TPA: TonB-dependent receptor [Candidatus Limnocylindrales bacterium]|nr:TonB-dependent receptor [Candidatus Limnocylindrales bacterium]